MASSGKYALTEDDTFFGKMKLNDPDTLGEFNSYGDFIVNRYNLALQDLIEHGSTDLPLNYTTKQKSADVFDADDAEFAITGAEYFDIFSYTSGSSLDSSRTNTINAIKSNITKNGAAAISSHYNEEKCMYKDGQNWTIIDRSSKSFPSGTFNACYDTSAGDTGHAMTLVGWDDNWAYKDNETDMTGAFIIQNS